MSGAVCFRPTQYAGPTSQSALYCTLCPNKKYPPKQLAVVQCNHVSFVRNFGHDNLASSQETTHITLEKNRDNVNFITVWKSSLKIYSLQHSSFATIILKVRWSSTAKEIHQKTTWMELSVLCDIIHGCLARNRRAQFVCVSHTLLPRWVCDPRYWFSDTASSKVTETSFLFVKSLIKNFSP